MTFINKPFVTSGYITPEYFCDREKETEILLRWLVNENNVAIISTRRMGKSGLIQHCPNARFIFAGSQRHLMGEMFVSPARPFYQSVSILHLTAIDKQKYIEFAQHHFRVAQKEIDEAVIVSLYDRFEGITWYLQKILNILFAVTSPGETCNEEMIEQAIHFILDSYSFTYSELLYQLPEKQKELMVAICKEGKATALTSGKFIRKYSLPSSSSVQSALKGLLEKDFVTKEENFYMVYDRFFSLWLMRNF